MKKLLVCLLFIMFIFSSCAKDKQITNPNIADGETNTETISVKIHADGNNSSSVKGVSVLVPGSQYVNDEAVIEKSKLAGELILEAFVNETNAANRGLSVRNDLTGFNWSKVPIVLVEMGFMTNPEEDKLMESEEYQNKMVQGITTGIEKYFDRLMEKK